VPDLVHVRLMASIPFASRYRMIDFTLSSMVNSDVSNISILVNNNYHSLMDHLGSGREWDLTRKNGGLNIVPPFAERNIKSYSGRVDGLASILTFLSSQKEKYVVLSDANIATSFDFNDMIQAHIEKGADVTVAYNESHISDRLRTSDNMDKEQYYTFGLTEDGRITNIEINSKAEGLTNFSMCIYVMEREFLIKEIKEAYMRGAKRLERDILIPRLNDLKIYGYRYDGYAARITDLKSYFDENMKLLDEGNLDQLFSGHQIYTKIRDDNPTRYINGSKAKNVMVADGCVIEGEIENCVLFRGVKIGKGAKVKNCVLMQDTVIEAGAQAEYVITDKKVTIGERKVLKGESTYPLYIAKHQTV
jgi:glucose-1-phosphate adenylyltransferase